MLEHDSCEECNKKLHEEDITICCFECCDVICLDCSTETYIWRCDEEDASHFCENCKIKDVCKKHTKKRFYSDISV